MFVKTINKLENKLDSEYNYIQERMVQQKLLSRQIKVEKTTD